MQLCMFRADHPAFLCKTDYENFITKTDQVIND